jgi:hypothetical protein
MQAGGHAFRKHVMRHPPGAVGSVAGEEAGVNLRAQLLIASAALTERLCQPGIEPTPRDNERLANPAGQIPRCFAMNPNFTSIPSRSRPQLFLGCPAPPSA